VTWIRNRPLGLVHRDKRKSFGGYTLYSPVRGHHADLLDPEGRIVHQWQHPEGIQHVRWLANGHLLVQTLPPEDAEGAEKIGGSAGAIVELDRASNVVWEHRDVYMHHDYQRLEDGTTLYIRWEKLPPDVAARVQGGHASPNDPDWMWGDAIVQIDADGQALRTWRSWDHLSTDHHVKCPLESRKEWTHCNSLELTAAGDWLLSFRLTDTVAIVDGRTGDVRWRWGAGHLSHQHHATWLDDGHIQILDNGCHRREAPSFSQVVEVDPKERKVVWSYQAEPILAFFSFMISGAERLPNGNVLVTEGATGRLFEVTPAGETVWEFVAPWLLPSQFGDTTAVFRSYRVAETDPRLDGLELSPAPYDDVNARTAAGELLRAVDEPGRQRRRRGTGNRSKDRQRREGSAQVRRRAGR
jgi:hypothetical protein